MKKNILIILPWLPWPLNSGGDQAMFNGIKAIQNDCNVVVVYMEGRKDRHKQERLQLNKILPNVTILPCLYNPFKVKGFALLDLICEKLNEIFIKDNRKWLCRRMISKYALKPEERIAYIIKVINDYNISIVQCEMLSQLSWGLSLPQNVKKVFVHHELGFVRDELSFKGNVCDPYVKTCIQASKLIELSLLNEFDKIITLSDIDATKLYMAGVNTSITPSFAIVDTNVVNKLNIKYKYELSFVGPENHSPNKIGLECFLCTCWNKLLEINDGYCLNIIGAWTNETKERLQKQYKNLVFRGFVPDLYSAINNTTMIVPITIGSGIRMKILEAASCGVPIVTTKVGVEGIPFKDGIHACVSDKIEDFIEKIIFLENYVERERMAANAIKVIKQKYSLEALTKDRLNTYNQLYCDIHN